MGLTKHDRILDVVKDFDPRELVAAERTRQKFSLDDACAAARQNGATISRELWRQYENGEAGLTDKVRTGVARAFLWQEDWPENPPELTERPRHDEIQDIKRRLDRIESMLERLFGGESPQDRRDAATGS